MTAGNKIHKIELLLLAASFAFCTPVYSDPEGTDLNNLPKPVSPRFKITEKIWPVKYGGGDICLWRDDKLAACSITIDDNTAVDHDWWIEQGGKYGWKFTWFIITGRIQEKDGYFGTWRNFIKLHQAGHDIQSHTVTHRDKKISMAMDEDYREAVTVINKNIPGSNVVTLAYPGGALPNDPAVAAQYYIAARGTAAIPNCVNAIDYMNVNSSGTFSLTADNWNGLPNAITCNSKYENNYRAWQCYHFHRASDALNPMISAGLEYLNTNKDKFWIGTFTEIARYGQERDTATLKTTVINDQSVTLLLTDKMADSKFDFPLTVKVRVNNDWSKCTATQADKQIPVEIVEHENNKYALVQAVPDRGEIELKKD